MDKIKKFLVGGTAAAMILGSAVTAFAAVNNGSFETGSNPGSFTTLSSGDALSITDWKVESGSIDYIGTYWPASDGTRSIDLNGTEAGSISQEIPTVSGTMYKVTFDMSGNPDNEEELKTLDVTADGGQAGSFSYNTAVGNSLADMKWAPKEYTFTAGDTSTLLKFTSTLANAFGAAIDNVVVTEVVEDPTPDIPEQCDQETDYNVINGTNGSDNIQGTNGPDLIFAMDGSDKVTGNGGADCIVGGDGSDKLIGGNGKDVILGGNGSDSLEGNNQDDKLYGDDGSDSLRGGNGEDSLWGGDDSDSLRGENGKDVLDGGDGSDSLRGGDANDDLTGGAGVDSANGENGNQDVCVAESETNCEL